MNPRPTTATLTCAEAFGGTFPDFLVMTKFRSNKVFFNHRPGRDYVRNAPRRGFAFDDEIAFKVQLLKHCEKGAPINLASANGHFFTPGPSRLGARCVLDVN